MSSGRPSSRPWSRVPRTFAAVLLGLQALLWGGGSILEARVAAESITRYSHVEDESAACPPIHSHLDCIVCRTLTGGATSGSAPTLPARARAGTDRPGSDVGEFSGQGSCGGLGSRAPPSA